MKAFPKIFAVGNPQVADIFNHDVEITEKLDGSQFGFGFINGELWIRSKGARLYPGTNDKLFGAGVEYIQSIEHVLRMYKDIAFYGEIISRPRHNVLTYNSVPFHNIALFGAHVLYTDVTLEWDRLKLMADELAVDVVPKLFEGKINDINQLQELIDQESYLGGPQMEGAVIKAHKPLDWRGLWLPITCAKFVSEKFKEKHVKDWTTLNTSKGGLESLKAGLRTEARWEKAVQHLREAGTLESDPRDIGALIKEVQRDIIDEEKEWIKAQLWQLFSKDILRTSTAGLPEWYKQKLLSEVFE